MYTRLHNIQIYKYMYLHSSTYICSIYTHAYTGNLKQKKKETGQKKIKNKKS